MFIYHEQAMSVSQRISNMNNTAKNINSYHLRMLSLASTFYKNETIVEQQFM